VQKTISLPARWRLDHDVYKYPVEIWLNNNLKRRVAASKPAIDAKRLANTPAEAAC
jgi:anaerobic magnesium-protoporphyrin IX monomethyl ester cyclase